MPVLQWLPRLRYADKTPLGCIEAVVHAALLQAEGRSDVLLFTSEPFVEDTAIVGRIRVTLYVSSDQVDTDFMVKITDVYPVLRGGASVLIGDTAQRMRWRNGVDGNATLMDEGKVGVISRPPPLALILAALDVCHYP